MARKFQRKPDLFFCYVPFCGRVEKNQILEDERCIPYLGVYFVEVTKPEDLLPPVPAPLSFEEEAKMHLADILPEEMISPVAEELSPIEPSIDVAIAEIPISIEPEPGLEIKKGRRKKSPEISI